MTSHIGYSNVQPQGKVPRTDPLFLNAHHAIFDNLSAHLCTQHVEIVQMVSQLTQCPLLEGVWK